MLGTLPRLEEVSLRDADVTDAGLIALTNAKTLTSLCVECTEVTDASLPYLKKLPHLNTLWLGTGIMGHGPNITDRGMEMIGEMTSLTSLDLSGTRITDKGLVYLKKLRGLTNLTIDDTRITEAGLVSIESLQAFERVRLYLGGGHPLTDVWRRPIWRSLNRSFK